MRPFRLLAFLLILLGSMARAEDAVTLQRLAPPPDVLRYGHSEHYGVYMDGAKIGWDHERVVPDVRDGRKVYVSAGTMRMHLASLGDEVEMIVKEELIFASLPPYALLGGSSEVASMGEVQRTEIVRTDDGFKAVVIEPGSRRELAIDDLDYALTDLTSSMTWLAEPRTVGDTLVTRSFSTADLEMDVVTEKVASVSKGRIDGVETTWCDVDIFSEKDGRLGRYRADANGHTISFDLTDGLELRREPARVARDLSQIVDVFVMRLITVDRALGNPTQAVSCVFQVQGPGTETLFDGPSQTVVRDSKTGATTLKTGAHNGNRVRASKAEIAEALKETIELPIENAGVKALAAEAVGDAVDRTEQVRRLVAFVGAYIEDAYGEDSLSVLEVIKKCKGDCTEHAELFATLARAAGVPARTVGGLVYGGDEMRAFGGHAWCEVVIDGHWHEVDPSWEEVEVNATHIRFSASGNHKEDAHLAAGASVKVLRITRR